MSREINTKINKEKEPKWLSDYRQNMSQKAFSLPKNLKYGLQIGSELENKFLEHGGTPSGELHRDILCETSGDVEVSDFDDAIKNKEVENKIKSVLEDKKLEISSNYYFSENLANFEGGLVVVVPEQKKDSYVNLKSNITKNSTELIFVIAKKDSSVIISNVISKKQEFKHIGEIIQGLPLDGISKDSPWMVGRTVVIVAEENSSVKFINFNDCPTENTYYFSNIFSVSGQNAKVEVLDINVGGEFSKSDVCGVINGDGGEIKIKTFVLSDGNQNFDLYNTPVHSSSHTNSKVDTLGVLGGESNVIYRGLVELQKNVKAVTGDLDSKFILSSEKAKIDAMPYLEIESDDVTCSHSLSISYLSDEQLFYPSLRGMTNIQSQKLIINGRVGKMFEGIDLSEEIKAAINVKLDNILSNSCNL